MALTKATISGPILGPDGETRLNVKVTIRAVAANGTVKSTEPGGAVLAGEKTAQSANDGTLSVTLPLLPQANVAPADARWRATFVLLDFVNRRGSKPETLAPIEFELTGATTWAALVDVSGVPVTQSLLAAAEAARDSAVAANVAAQAARTDAEAAAADAVDISNIAVPDDVVGALIEGAAGAGPLTRGALDATIDRTAVTVGQTMVNVSSYGDDLEAAIADAPASARFHLDKTLYTFDTPLNFDGSESVTFVGAGCGVDRDHEGLTEIRYTAAGAGPAITVRGSQGFTMEKLMCRYGNSGFSGTFIDAQGGGPAAPTYRPSFTDVVLGGTGGAAVTAEFVLDLGDTVEPTLRDAVVARAQNGIRARGIDTTYCFAFNMWGGRFVDLVGDAVRNPHQMSFYGTVFENAIDGTAAGFTTDDPAKEVFGLNFYGGGFYDVSQPSVWLDVYGGSVNAYGTRVELAAGVTFLRARSGVSQPFNGASLHDIDVAGPSTSYLFEHVGPGYVADFTESGCKYLNGARRWAAEPDRLRYAIQRQNMALPIVTADASLTAKATDGFLMVDSTAGPVTVTMPDALDDLLCPKGTQLVVKNYKGANNVSCNPGGGQRVDGGFGLTLAPGESRVFVSDALAAPGGWHTIAKL